MAIIQLDKGYEALVDDEDLDLVSRFKWKALVCKKPHVTKVYAVSRKMTNYVSETTMMHRLILGVPKGLIPDHRDGNGLNNHRDNLRPGTFSQNNQSARVVRGKTPFKGVELHFDGRFRARIRKDDKRMHIGCFIQAEDAAQAYDLAAVKYFGEFAVTNSALGLL